jgi:hypothetical protein
MTIARRRFGKNRQKVGIVEPERKSISGQRFGEHVPAATNSRNNPLLANGLPAHVSAATNNTRDNTNCSGWWSLDGSPQVIKQGLLVSSDS